MIFLTRGNVLRTSTNGGRRTSVSIDLSKSYCLGENSEKLIPWALDLDSGSTLPASTVTVQSVKEVEGFDLMADDLRFLANQFRHLNVEEVQHILRFHSQSWRRRSARFIQAVWRHNRWKKRSKSARFLQAAWHLNRQKKREKSAGFIQAAWRVNRQKKLEQSLRENEGRQLVGVGTSASRT